MALKSQKYLPALRRMARQKVVRYPVTVVNSAAMGLVFTIPADPGPRKLDLSVNAPGWVPLHVFRRRHYA